MKRNELLQQLTENFQGMYRGMLHKSDAQKDGIPFGQKAALFTIASQELINVKQIASILHITSGAATQHVEALVQEGLVERTVDPQDRRNVIVRITTKGKKLIQRLKQKRILMMKELFSDITDEELVAHIDVMEKVNSKLK